MRRAEVATGRGVKKRRLLRKSAGERTNRAFCKHVATSSGKQDEVVGWEELALFSHVSWGIVSIVAGAIAVELSIGSRVQECEEEFSKPVE